MSKQQTPRRSSRLEKAALWAGIIGAVAAVIAILPHLGSGFSADSPQSASPPAAHQTAGAQAGSPTPAEPPSRTFKDVILKQHAGVDVDGSSALIAPDLNGITADNDMYHDATPVSSNRLITPAGVYTYPRGESVANAYRVCSDYLGDSHNSLDLSIGFDTGQSFCFKTSDDRLAWAQMTALDGSPGIYHSVTLKIRIWNK